VGQPAHQDVFQHIQPADQVELLEDHRASAAPVAQRRAGHRGHVGTLPRDPAGAGIDQTVQHAQEGRFAGAGTADHADELAARHAQ
jgi:hypothetical protein